ncbi:hemocyte protein-glutamine gamma-glutamyltransferase-like protein [Leptotrombidium deliense]|uniref:Hemocyte protein-glutamine gamma-glutamyltransferase-like protein n=1 Tax=Leptotrombidium deliense TaxID=299467 RepID=A0A443SJA6_9ACAR|nr:hemocyte protein-glutamine gamma-glutamyltransferase-like protein [Leptotrombidium deliense]
MCEKIPIKGVIFNMVKGPRPQLGRGTLIYLPVTSKREFTKEKSKWDARMHEIDGNTITIQVHIPANVGVGIWKLRVSTKQQGSRNIKSFDVREKIYVLFNPWCKEDAVYMANEEWRREYILNDVGKLYIGSHSKPKGRKWIYGQFTEAVLPAVMFMMDKTKLNYEQRANPVEVARSVAAMVNSHDDNGLLVVNADVVHWQLDEKSQLGWKKIKTNKYQCGVDDNSPGGLQDAEDITDLYKYKEGTEEERMAVLNAARSAGLSFLFELPEPGKEDVDFDLKDITGVLIGQPFFIMVEMINRSPYPRTVTLVVNTNSVYYTGILARKVKRDRQIIQLGPGQRETIRLRVTAEEYLDKLVDYAMMKIYAVATVKETQQTWSEEDDFVVEKPPLYIEIRGRPSVGAPFGLEIKFTNPLNRYLTDCKFTIEGPGLTRPMQVKIRDIGPRESIMHVEQLVPRKPGPRNVVVVFQSRELIDVVGSKAVDVYG